MENKTLFEIKQQSGDSFKTTAELYTSDGYFVKCSDNPSPSLIDLHGNSLTMVSVTMSGCTFSGCMIGIWLKKNGKCLIGVNGLI